jgi:tetratricopeptide (TPR) repeat protein
MAKGIAPLDKEFVNEQFRTRVAEAKSAQGSGDIVAAERAWREIAGDFRTFRDVKGLEELARTLAASEDFRKARKNERAMLDLQDDVAKKVGNLVAGINQEPDNRTAFMGQLHAAVNDAYREQRGSSSAERKNAIARGLASAFAYAAETGQQAMLKKDYLPAKDMFQAGATILPDSPYADYLLATVHAQLGEKKAAIQELKKAIAKGMTNPKLLEDRAFDRLREEGAFKDILARLSAPRQ